MRRARLPHETGGNPEQRGARAGSQKTPRWSAERRAFSRRWENAWRPDKAGASVPVMARRDGWHATTWAPPALRHPSFLRVAKKTKEEERRRRGRERKMKIRETSS